MAGNNLHRFVSAQSKGVYETALHELWEGRKQGHWMWFIFPQMKGLGRSQASNLYGIHSLDEAVAYLTHPILGPRLVECVNELLSLQNHCTANDIFGTPDSVKLRSSLTLFEKAAIACNHDTKDVFSEALERYYNGVRDELTIGMLQEDQESPPTDKDAEPPATEATSQHHAAPE